MYTTNTLWENNEKKFQQACRRFIIKLTQSLEKYFNENLVPFVK